MLNYNAIEFHPEEAKRIVNIEWSAEDLKNEKIVFLLKVIHSKNESINNKEQLIQMLGINTSNKKQPNKSSYNTGILSISANTNTFLRIVR